MTKKGVSTRVAPRWYGWLVLVILGSSLLFTTIIRPGSLGGVGDELGGILQLVVAIMLLGVVLIIAGVVAWWLIQALVRVGVRIAEAEASFWDDGEEMSEEDAGDLSGHL